LKALNALNGNALDGNLQGDVDAVTTATNLVVIELNDLVKQHTTLISGLSHRQQDYISNLDEYEKEASSKGAFWARQVRSATPCDATHVM
jgi:hypothetical protein